LGRRIFHVQLLASALSESTPQIMESLVAALKSGSWSVPSIPRCISSRDSSRSSADDMEMHPDGHPALPFQQDAFDRNRGTKDARARNSTGDVTPMVALHGYNYKSTLDINCAGKSACPARLCPGNQPVDLEGALRLIGDQQKRLERHVGQFPCGVTLNSSSGSCKRASCSSQESTSRTYVLWKACPGSEALPQTLRCSTGQAQRVKPPSEHLPGRSCACSFKGSCQGVSHLCARNYSLRHNQVGMI
jgi:hypothetical protein